VVCHKSALKLLDRHQVRLGGSSDSTEIRNSTTVYMSGGAVATTRPVRGSHYLRRERVTVPGQAHIIPNCIQCERQVESLLPDDQAEQSALASACSGEIAHAG